MKASKGSCSGRRLRSGLSRRAGRGVRSKKGLRELRRILRR